MNTATVKTSASFTDTTWAFRLMTPRSSARTTRMKRRNPPQIHTTESIATPYSGTRARGFRVRCARPPAWRGADRSRVAIAPRTPRESGQHASLPPGRGNDSRAASPADTPPRASYVGAFAEVDSASAASVAAVHASRARSSAAFAVSSSDPRRVADAAPALVV